MRKLLSQHAANGIQETGTMSILIDRENVGIHIDVLLFLKLRLLLKLGYVRQEFHEDA
jgi:hypothetical protein